MDPLLSDRVQHIQPSPTLAIGAKAAALKAKGVDVISLSLGEPDFDTPAHIKKAAMEAISRGFTQYTAVEGILELRKAVVAKFKRDNHLHYEPHQILISNGAKQSFFNLAQALLNTGDEVIIPAPYWVSYPDMVLLADAKPVIIEARFDQHFKITPSQLEKAITAKTRLLVINSPSNPTGMAYTAAELKALSEVLLAHPNIFIISDDIYEHILWKKGSFYNLLMVSPELSPRTVLIHGVSKTYAMTGFRIGYAAGPEWLIKAMGTIQGQSTSNPCSISQMAALEALNGDQSCVEIMVNAFKERHDFIVSALNEIPGIECLKTDGTFYAFPRVEQLIQRLKLTNDVELSEFLLQNLQIAVVPGTAFGAPGYIRLSFATSLDNLHEAIKRLKTSLPR